MKPFVQVSLVQVSLMLASLAATAVSPASARPHHRGYAGGPPRLNIEATCRRAQPLSGGDKSAYQGCMNDETQARTDLAKAWSGFPGPARSTCVQETQIGGAPSYVELLTCLELDKQAREASRENRKALRLPRNQPVNPGPAKPSAPPKS